MTWAGHGGALVTIAVRLITGRPHLRQPRDTLAGGCELTTLEEEIRTTMAINPTLCRGRDAA